MVLPENCRCYLINLARAPQRLAAMSNRLGLLGIAFERIEGVDGSALEASHFQALIRDNRYYKPLRPGEAGCYLGHIRALQAFLASSAEFALVLEDDACLLDGFQLTLQDALSLRESTSDASLGWDVLKLCNSRRRWMPLARLNAEHDLVEYGPSVPSTTTSAVWTRVGAERFVAAFKGVQRPVDCDLQHPWEYGLRILSVHPPTTEAEPVPSTMGQRKARSFNPLPKLNYEARRLWPRWKHFSTQYGPWFWLRWARGETRHVERAQPQ